MLARFTHGDIVWVDLESPTREEVLTIVEEFNIDESVAEELLQPTVKPRYETHDDHCYLIMHFPALRHSHSSREQEVDFVIGKKFLLTVHYDTIDPLHKFSKVFEVNAVLEKTPIGDHAGYLLYYILMKLYRSVDHEIEFIHQELSRIEDSIFSGEEAMMLHNISRLGRDLLSIRQIIEPHRDVLTAFEEQAPSFFGQKFAQFTRTLSHEYYRVHNHVMRHSETLRELRHTNDSLLANRQNDIMRILTIMALFTFPLALLVAVSDTHLDGNPFADSAFGFPILVGLIVVIASSMFAVFKFKRWI